MKSIIYRFFGLCKNMKKNAYVDAVRIGEEVKKKGKNVNKGVIVGLNGSVGEGILWAYDNRG